MMPAHFTGKEAEAGPSEPACTGSLWSSWHPEPLLGTNWPCPLSFWNPLPETRDVKFGSVEKSPRAEEEESHQARGNLLPLTSPALAGPAAFVRKGLWF